MIRSLSVTMGVIRIAAVMVRVTALHDQAAFQFIPSFVEKLYHAFSRGLVKDRSQGLEILDASLDQGEHMFGSRSVEKTRIPTRYIHR